MQRKAEPEQTEIIAFDSNDTSRLLFGQQNENLKAIEKELDIRVDSPGGEVTLCGEAEKIRMAVSLLNQLYEIAERQYPLTSRDVVRAIGILEKEPETKLVSLFLDNVVPIQGGRKSIAPKSPAQNRYIDAVRKNDLVFSVGPAGTGKTYLAMALAVSCLQSKGCKRIVLTRPAVEAGERLGFLPGDIAEKVNPYLRPLYDALYDMVDFDKAQLWFENGVVEVAPLAFMRGRTLNDSFIILDEAQNTTPEQMKMFLTRMGFGSKAVVTGDITQIDLPENQASGMVNAVSLLGNIEGIEVCRLTDVDVVRHPLVQRVIQAYENEENNNKNG